MRTRLAVAEVSSFNALSFLRFDMSGLSGGSKWRLVGKDGTWTLEIEISGIHSKLVNQVNLRVTTQY